MSENGVRVQPFEAGDAQRWDAFVGEALNGTFLHSRRFLGYHGDRFRDLSLLFLDERGRLVGLLPAAAGSEPELVDSHPGITYGGLLHRGDLSGEQALVALRAASRHYHELGYRTLRYRAIPRPYHRRPAEDDSYALFRLDARRSSVNLSAAFELAAARTPSELRQRDAKKAGRSGVSVEVKSAAWQEFWSVLEATLATRHHSKPVHTVAEMPHLAQLFPEEIELVLARIDREPVAGTVLFHSGTVTHTQYLASAPIGRDTGALTRVVEAAIERARERGSAWFSTGTCNEDGGRVLNSGLYRWKLSFGAGGVVHETFDVPL
jgi:hypothetical protein